jgi:hypothetical protein
MVGGMNSFTYAQGNQDVSVFVSAAQQAEMYAVRYLQQHNKLFLTDQEKAEIKKLFGL